ncbi:MAG: HAMP domain-containing histidine kinase [Bdellovibrionales bacterium]|nr:HAMP domain-containing histidine kinase [Bdellovibrionales bacterium]
MGLFLRTYFEEPMPSIQPPAISMESFFRAAHDLRSPLSAVNLTIHHLKQASPDLDHLGLLDEAVKRINNIAEEILQARKQAQGPQKAKPVECFDLCEAIKCFAREAKFQLQNSMELEGFHKNLPQDVQALGNIGDFHRILWNLIQNAKEADATCWSLTWKETSEQIILKIRDNGAGIPARTLKKIGQEGFTTKKKGNGLGLYSAIQTMHTWQGDLTVTSQHHIGTTIEISFTKS